MTFEELTRDLPGWLVADGPDPDMVISSRIRIARNLAGRPYSHRADPEILAEIVETVLEESPAAGFEHGNFFCNDTLEENQKAVLIERHIISPFLASKSGNRGVVIREDESSSIMINEEDHLRIQSMAAGFDLMGALEVMDGISGSLSEVLKFSRSDDYGWLTACPSNMGSGLRASVLIHLPALILTKEIQRVVRSAGQLGMAVRGYRGEGSEVVGNLFQISNQTSMGKTSKEIVTTLIEVVGKIIDYEKKAVDVLRREAKHQIEDKIWRSAALLKSARVLSSHEFMGLSSAVRMGVRMGIFTAPGINTLNELLVITQPGHMQLRAGTELSTRERDVRRADIVRQRCVDLSL
jgi:protein arginine kinase